MRPTAVARKLELDNTTGLGWGRMRVCRPGGRQPRGHGVDASGGLGGSVTQGSRWPIHESGQWSYDVRMLDRGQALQGEVIDGSSGTAEGTGVCKVGAPWVNI